MRTTRVAAVVSWRSIARCEHRVRHRAVVGGYRPSTNTSRPSSRRAVARWRRLWVLGSGHGRPGDRRAWSDRSAPRCARGAARAGFHVRGDRGGASSSMLLAASSERVSPVMRVGERPRHVLGRGAEQFTLPHPARAGRGRRTHDRSASGASLQPAQRDHTLVVSVTTTRTRDGAGGVDHR